MFINDCKEITRCELVAKSGAPYIIKIVTGDLHKYGRDSDGREVKIACTHGVRSESEGMVHEWNFATRREACDYFGRMVSDKLYNGYCFSNG